MIIAVRTRCLLVTLVAVILHISQAMAGPVPASKSVRDHAARYLREAVAARYANSHADVDIGPIDERLDLSGCLEPIFFLTPGSRLWGAGNLGVQCGAPDQLNFYVTYRVRLKGPALLARRPLPSGYSPLVQDLVTAEIEYTTDPARYPLSAQNLHGARLIMPLARNAPLTIGLLRAKALIQAGQRVRIVTGGSGFQVTQEGIAQQQASAGDLLRLKLASGRYVQGTVQTDGTVFIEP